MELRAAVFSAWREVVRFEVKVDFGLVDEVRRPDKGEIMNASSGDSSSSAVGMRGWSKAQSSDVGTDRDICFFRLDMDRLLRTESGVERLPVETMDLSSASSEGTDSEEGERS